jgi:cytochrome c
MFQERAGVALLALLACALPTAAAHAADAAPRALRSCVACHTFDKGGHSKIGPNLWGIVGAKAAHDPNYGKYGDDFLAAAATGLTWTDANLDAYIAEPLSFLREVLGKRAVRTYMVTRVPREADRAAILDYLKSLKDD